MVDPVRNWRRPSTELHPDLKKEVEFLRRGDSDGDHYCLIHPDMLESHNNQLFTHHQLEAFRQAVEDVKIELNMNSRFDTSSIILPDGRAVLIVELVPADIDPGSLPELHPDDAPSVGSGPPAPALSPLAIRRDH